MAVNTNVVVLVGRLTRDPELRALPSGSSLCEVRVGVNGLKKNNAGEYEDKGNFFNVTIFGRSAELLAKHCTKGDQVAITGRLEMQEWDTSEGQHRETVKVVANSVEFLAKKTDSKGSAPTKNNNDEDIPF